MFRPEDLFDLSQTAHAEVFGGCDYAWQALGRIAALLRSRLRPSSKGAVIGGASIGPDVFIGEGTVVEDGVMIKGPAWIGRNCEIRHGAYIRENVIVGDHCVVGNSSELKNSLLFNHAAVPHFNYVGDSILGFHAHLGAGVKISNLKVVPGNVMVEAAEGRLIDSGLRKFGALMGDYAEVGCNAVLNPGSIIGRRGLIYPNTNWRGALPENHIAKNKASVEVVVRRFPGPGSAQ
jgi:NDP-sugar pyrophosphorylase family protein